MPWRKYKSTEGKYGPKYHITKGVAVRRNKRGDWLFFAEKGGERTNKSFGKGREALVNAIAAAEAIARELHQSHAAHSDTKSTPKVPQLTDFSKVWLERNEGRWHCNTYERYATMLRIYLFPDPELKNKQLDKIERHNIKNFLVRLFKKRSAATVEMAYTVLHSIFEEAIDDKLVIANPVKGLLKKILPPKSQRNEKEADPFTVEARDQFLDYAKKWCSWEEQLILKMMCYAGLRLGESLAVRLRNMDFTNLTYHVTESFKQHRFSKPKGSKKRRVDLPDFLMEELKDYILQLKKRLLKSGKGGEIDLLFLDPKEQYKWPYSQRRVQNIVKKVCTGAGLRCRNPHDLRHTYASILLMSHQSPAYVQRLLGHSSIAITVDIYGHWISGEGRFGLENALRGCTKIAHKPHTDLNLPR
jgi:integrase